MASSSSPNGTPNPQAVALAPSVWRQNLLKAALSVIVLAVLFWKLNARDVWAQLEQAALIPLLVAAGLLLAQTALMAWRWQHLGRRIAHLTAANYPDLISHWRILMASLWFSLALPSSLGGDAVRVLMLVQRGIRLSLATRSVVLDRISALAAVVVMILFCIPGLAAVAKSQALTNSLAGLTGLGVVGLAVLLILDRLVVRWRGNRLIDFAAELSINARAIFRMPEIAGAAIVIHTMTALSFYAVAVSTGLGIGPIPVLLIIPPVIFLSALPISISGWGVREGSLIIGLGLFGIDPTAALAASILFGLCSSAVGLAGGIVWLAARKVDKPVGYDN